MIGTWSGEDREVNEEGPQSGCVYNTAKSGDGMGFFVGFLCTAKMDM